MHSLLQHVALLAPVPMIILFAVGCSQDRAGEPAPSAAPSSTTSTPTVTITATVTPTTVAPTTVEPTTLTTPPPETAPPTEAAVPTACSDDDMTITNDEVASANTLRRVVISFTNTSSRTCTLVGYPDADLVTAAGGVLVHVERRPANSAPHLELHPGEVATADVQTSAIDPATGENCSRIGTLSVALPGNGQPHLLKANLPICDPTISSVG